MKILMEAKQTGWIGMLIALDAVSTFAQVVHVVTSFTDNTTCGHNTNGTFTAIIDAEPDVEKEYTLGEPEYAWSGDDLLDPTDKETVSVAIGADRTGSVSATVTVTWQIYHNGEPYRAATATASCSVKITSGVAVSFAPGMIGLDRTDAGETNKPGGATATLACGHDDSFFTWPRSTGACEIPKELPCEGQGLASVTYQTIDKELCSGEYQDQEITVTASPGGNATTNFTVVKVDVTIDGVGEDKEETEGAFIAYAEDNGDGTWTEQGMNALVNVTIQCSPEELPDEETITVAFPNGFLYEVVDGQHIAAQSSYKANEISEKQFVLHGHAVSGGLKDRTIQVTHDGSGAKDKAVFTVIKVVSIEPEQETYLEHYYLNSPLDSPTNRIYTIPVSPATIGNGTDDSFFVWPTTLKVTATIQPDIPEAKLPDSCMLLGGQPAIPPDQLTRYVERRFPKKAEFTFLNCGVDSGLKTTVYVFDARIGEFADGVKPDEYGEPEIGEVGHSWGEYWLDPVSDELLDETLSKYLKEIGFYPSGGLFDGALFGAPGVVSFGGEAGGWHPVTGSGDYRVRSFKRFRQSLALVHVKKTHPPDYHLFTYNCVDFAIDLGQWVGVTTMTPSWIPPQWIILEFSIPPSVVSTSWEYSNWLNWYPGLQY